jgi:mono/diheme cytochrome c family protein
VLLAVALGVACGEGDGSRPAATPPASVTTTTQPTPAPTTPPAPPATDRPGAAGPPGAPGDAARAEAEQIFATRCATCHGPDGAGNGPVAAALDPKPRDFRDASWQDSVSDAHVEKIIQHGGAAVGRSPAMPPNPDLVSRPELVAALRAKVRSLGGR